MLRIFLLLIPLFEMTALFAQSTFRSLEEVWEYAEENNSQILSMVNGRQIAQKNIGFTRGSLLPIVSATFALTDNIQIQPTLIPANLFGGEEGQFIQEQFGKRYVYNGNINAQLDLINTRNWFSIKAARYNYEIASLNLESSKRMMYEQTAQTWYSYHLATESTKLFEESLNDAQNIYETTKQKFSEGFVSEITVNNAHINYQIMKSRGEAAKTDQQLALNSLKLLLNLSPETITSLQPDSISLPVEDHVKFFPESDVSVKLAHAELRLASNQRKSALASYAPTLSIVYGIGRQLNDNVFLKFENTSALPQQYWGLRLMLPILTGSSRKFQLEKSKIDFKDKQLGYTNALKQTEINDQNLALEYTKAYNEFINSIRIIKLYKENDSHANRKMNEGIISMDERLKAHQDYVNYQQEHLQRMAEFFIQYYRLQVRRKALSI